jgi:hypothetical protein
MNISKYIKQINHEYELINPEFIYNVYRKIQSDNEIIYIVSFEFYSKVYYDVTLFDFYGINDKLQQYEYCYFSSKIKNTKYMKLNILYNTQIYNLKFVINKKQKNISHILKINDLIINLKNDKLLKELIFNQNNKLNDEITKNKLLKIEVKKNKTNKI